MIFSGSFLLSLMIFHLLPEIYKHSTEGNIGIFVALGIILQMMLEFFSKGVEHGHMHFHKEKNGSLSFMLFASLSIHSILEGLPVHYNEKLMYGIVAHNFPLAIILTSLFLKAGMKKSHQAMYILSFALMTPLGTLLGENALLERYHVEISAVVVGMLMHVSYVIIFESNEHHRFNLKKVITTVVGFAAAYPYTA